MPDEVVYPKFQSTLLQEERRATGTDATNWIVISIHAPTRGATVNNHIFIVPEVLISIHAPTRGATLHVPDGKHGRIISIHAPTRGATTPSISSTLSLIISIHAPTRGATIGTPEECRAAMEFQSTLLQEERQQKCTIFLMHLCNNYCIVSI